MSDELIEDFTFFCAIPMNYCAIFKAAKESLLGEASRDDFFFDLGFFFLLLSIFRLTFFYSLPSASNSASYYFYYFPLSFLSRRALMVIYRLAKSQPTYKWWYLWRTYLLKWSKACDLVLHRESAGRWLTLCGPWAYPWRLLIWLPS